jgi:hypothetical protein
VDLRNSGEFQLWRNAASGIYAQIKQRISIPGLWRLKASQPAAAAASQATLTQCLA